MDLQHLRASDGTGEAVLAHIQTVRNPGSTVLDLDNVDNWNTKAVIITGTPAANGFVSPVGMKVMYGHLNAGDFIIDGYAPGYADNGNTTAEVAIVKMTTSWADTLIDLLDNSLQDNGLLKVTSLDHFYKPGEITPGVSVNSGGIVAISAGLTGTFSNIVYYINGLRYTKTAVANKVYLASKDTYVDIGVDGVVDYNDVANNAAAPALAADHVRVAKVVTNGAGITAITQTGFDGLGNRVRPTGILTAANAPNLFYEELGRHNLLVAGDALTVANLPPRKHLRLLINYTSASGNIETYLRCNNDSAANYAYAFAGVGATPLNTGVSQTGLIVTGLTTIYNQFLVVDIINMATKEKSIRYDRLETGTPGAGTAPGYSLFHGKWANSAVPINRLDLINVGAGDLAIGSEMIVLGHD